MSIFCIYIVYIVLMFINITKRKRNISILKRKIAIQIDILKDMQIELVPPITRTRYLKVKFYFLIKCI